MHLNDKRQFRFIIEPLGRDNNLIKYSLNV